MPSFAAPHGQGRARTGAWLASVLAVSLSCVTAALSAAPRLDVPYVPTPYDVVHRMLEMAEVQPDDYLIDLGSGDGRIVISAVQDWNVQRAYGIDLDPQRIEQAQENARAAGVEDRVQFEQGDLFEKDISDANVLTMYLLSSVNYRLRPVILDTMKPGTRVVSHAFDMREWEPDETDTVGNSNIYLWIVPAKVGGRWELTTADDHRIELHLMQQFQQLQGTAEVNGSAASFSEASLRGDRISFTVAGEEYQGRVEGDRILPVQGEAAQGWHARRL